MKKLLINCLFAFLISCGGGGGGSDSTTTTEDDSSNDSNSGSSSSDDTGSSSSGSTSSSGFSKKVDVFGIPILATSGVSDAKVLHAANVMAEYLDNDNDGTVDNTLILDEMKAKNAFLFILASESEQDSVTLPSGEGQLLLDFETRPEGSSSAGFDATLEEVLHLISHVGIANAYPTVFGESIGTSLSNAMDTARGGQFTSIPNPYPSGAWYTYDDQTCDYSCMATEYFYWALTSILGAQEYSGRLDEIQNEWQLNTAAKVQASDPTIYALLTDTQYKLPTTIPDGTYTGSTLSIVSP